MNLIYCLSYLSLFYTIHIIENNKSTKFKIVTTNRKIKYFFEHLYDKENILFLDSYNIILPKSIFQLIYFPFKILYVLYKKRTAESFFKKYNSNNVYFFFNDTSFFQASIIKKLSNRNYIHFKSNLNLNDFTENKSLIGKLNKRFINLIYDIDVIPFNIENTVYFKFSDSFYKSLNINSFNQEINLKKISNFVLNKFQIDKGDVLLLIPMSNEWDIDHNLIINTYDHIVNICMKFNLTVHLKYHPRDNNNYYRNDNCFVIPSFIPANTLVNYKFVIGFTSAALWELSNIGINCFSLAKIFAPKNVHNRLIKHLNSNLNDKYPISFPNQIIDFEKIIESKFRLKN